MHLRQVIYNALTLQDTFDRSIQKILDNVNPAGSIKGTVIASPSTFQPDYFYHWTRDAALSMRSISDQVPLEYFTDYAYVSKIHQKEHTLAGLGEPKFYVDGRGFDGPWGRPQRDGPALRAIVFSEYLLYNWDIPELREWYAPTLPAHSLIKKDLEYVAHEWKLPCFDLWEEVNGMHFYTLMVQQAAMHAGFKVAIRYNDTGAALFYLQTKETIQTYLERFWDLGRQRVITTLSSERMDIAVILGCLHSRNNDKWNKFRCSSGRIMVTAAKLHGLFQLEYTINHNSDVPLMGRYPDDKYNGVGLGVGNPWILSTFSFAEYLYQIGIEFSQSKIIHVDRNSILLFHNVLNMKVQLGNVESSECMFHYILGNITHEADRYLYRVLDHTRDFSEQLHRDIGIPQEAKDLTWSYSSFVTAFKTRRQLLSMLKSAPHC